MSRTPTPVRCQSREIPFNSKKSREKAIKKIRKNSSTLSHHFTVVRSGISAPLTCISQKPSRREITPSICPYCWQTKKKK